MALGGKGNLTMSEAQKYASFAVEDMKAGTGLFDNVDATITNIQHTKEPPDNYTMDGGNPIFANVSFLLDGDGPEEERRVNQVYSEGAAAGDNFTISNDGYGLIPSNAEAAPRKDSKWGTFCAALQNEGVPRGVLAAGDFSKLIGLRGKFKRVADAERNFGADQRARPGQAKSKFPPSTLVLVKLHALPGEKGKAVATPATASANTTASAPIANVTEDDLDVRALEMLEKAIANTPKKQLQRSQIILAVTRAASEDPRKADIARRAADETFIVAMADAGYIGYRPAEKGQPLTLAAMTAAA